MARFNKLTSVFLCACPLIDDKLPHNIVKVAVEPQAAGTDVNLFFTKTRSETGEMLGIGQGFEREVRRV